MVARLCFLDAVAVPNDPQVLANNYVTDFDFLRARDGTLTTIDVPGAAGTQALAINPAGAIVGGYSDGGFLRAPDGTFTTFEGTPTSINPAGTMTGFYTDASSTVHGVLRIPCKPNGR